MTPERSAPAATMHIASHHPSVQQLEGGPRDAALASAAERWPRGPGSQARSPVARVFEGELVPRPIVAEQLVNRAHPAPLASTATAPPAPTDVPPPTASSKTLFYLLHSTNERLSAKTLGARVDQFA